MFTAAVAYLFLWAGGTALVLLWAGRRHPLPLGVAVGFGWGIGILGAAALEVLGGFHRLTVTLLSGVAFGGPILVAHRRQLWTRPSHWGVGLAVLIGVLTLGLWAEAASGIVWGDAVHNWFLKARAVATDGTTRHYFAHATPTSHPAYPPLHPLAVAWMTQLRGGWLDPAASLSGVFTLSAILVLAAATLAQRAGRLAAVIAVCGIAGLPFVQVTSVMGDADSLLAYFTLAGVLALLKTDGALADRFWLSLAALAAVGAALAKTEGVVIVGALMAAAALTVAGSVRRRLVAALTIGGAGVSAVLVWTVVRSFAMPFMPMEGGGVSSSVLREFAVSPNQLSQWRIGLLTVLMGLSAATWSSSFWAVAAVTLAWPRRWCRSTQGAAAAIGVALLGLAIAYAATRTTVSPLAARSLPRNLLLVYPLAVVLLVGRLAPNGAAVTRRTVLAVGVAALLVAGIPGLVAGTSRLRGGQLETGVSWSPPNAAVRIEPASARRGRAGLTINAGVSSGAIAVNRALDTKPGETLRLRYWARGSTEAIARVYVEWGGSQTGLLTDADAGAAGTDYWYWGGGRWQEREVVWTMPPGPRARAYVVAQAMRGVASFDDFTVTPVSRVENWFPTWWLVGAVLVGLALAGQVASTNLALVAVGAWATVMAGQTVYRQAPKAWGGWPAEVTRDVNRVPDRHRFLGLVAHAQRVRPWLDPTLPLVVRAGPQDWRHATTLEYLLYGRYTPGPASTDGRCNVVTFRRAVGTGAAVADTELALMRPADADHRPTVDLGDVSISRGDCPSTRLTRNTPATDAMIGR